MVENKGISYKEQAQFSNDSQHLEVTDKQFSGVNFEAAEPLRIGQSYLLVPQYNTAVGYDIDGVGKVYSKRVWAMPINGNSFGGDVRTIGVSRMRATGYKEIMSATDTKAPVITAIQQNGKWKFSEKASVKAMADTSFIKGREDSEQRKRFVINRPVIVTPTSESRVYVTHFDNGALDIKNNKLVLELNDTFMKFDVEDCHNQELIEAVTAALAADPRIKDHFYALD